MRYWQIKTAKLATFAGATAGLIWFLWPVEGWQFTWWPFWTTLSSFAAFGISEWRETALVRKIYALDSVLTEHDVALISQFRNLLPSNGKAMRFIAEHGMGNSFDGSALREAEIFSDEWEDPERTFHDSDLEKQKESLRQEISQFLSELALKVGPASTGGMLSVIPPKHIGEFDVPSRFLKAASELNNMAREVANRHSEFIRLCEEKISGREKVLTLKSSELI